MRLASGIENHEIPAHAEIVPRITTRGVGDFRSRLASSLGIQGILLLIGAGAGDDLHVDALGAAGGEPFTGLGLRVFPERGDVAFGSGVNRAGERNRGWRGGYSEFGGDGLRCAGAWDAVGGNPEGFLDGDPKIGAHGR